VREGVSNFHGDDKEVKGERKDQGAKKQKVGAVPPSIEKSSKNEVVRGGEKKLLHRKEGRLAGSCPRHSTWKGGWEKTRSGARNRNMGWGREVK